MVITASYSVAVLLKSINVGKVIKVENVVKSGLFKPFLTLKSFSTKTWLKIHFFRKKLP